MFKKLRYAYHMSICERMIKEDKAFDPLFGDWTRKFKRHRDKVSKILGYR